MAIPCPDVLVRYRPYRAGDEERILALYNAVFATSRTVAQWRWEYCENPQTRLDVVVAEADAILVGHSAAVPMTMRHDGGQIAGARVQNVFVHENFQRRGIFAETLVRLTRQLEAEAVDFVLTFPNDNSLPGFMRMGGYEHRFDVFSLALPLDRLGGAKSADCTIEIGSPASFRSADAAFAARRLAPFAIYNLRSLEYLRWRYHANSGRTYRVLRVSRSGEQVGLAVAKAYAAGGSLDLVEFLVAPEQTLVRTALAALAKHFAPQRLERLSLWSLAHDPLHACLREIGFVPQDRPTHVVTRTFSARCSRRCGEPQAYYLAMGDCDVY